MRWVGEASNGRLALEPVPPGHVAAPDQHAVWEVRMDAGGPGPLWGSVASAVDTELPFLRGTWRVRTHPRAGNRSGATGLVRKEVGPWAWLLRPLRVVTDNYADFVLLQ